MDNPLSDKKKQDDPHAQDRQSATPSAQGVAVGESGKPLNVDIKNVSLGAYAGAGGYHPDLSTKTLDELKQWKKSMPGRLAIRAFSRGILGAAFFAGGGLLAKKWMKDYDPEAGLSEQLMGQDGNPLKALAKVIDKCVGRPIEMTVGALAGEKAGLNAVRFRPTQFITGGTPGRTLGAETIDVTFNFFSASIGDAWGRSIAGMVDPNVKKPWRDAKGKFSVDEAILNSAKALFDYITYRGGEDWAVAIPYVYYMKGQRALIDRMSPGFKYDFDASLNGGSHKIRTRHDVSGNEHHQVVGNYAQEAMLDFQGRFTAYNIGTLLYREVYNYWRNRLTGKAARLYGSPDDDTRRGVMGTVADLGKWLARGTIKGVIYMTPAMPFFSVFRANQNRHKGMLINDERGLLSRMDEAMNDDGTVSRTIHSVRARDGQQGIVNADSELFYSKFDPRSDGTHWSVDYTVHPKRPAEFIDNHPFSSGKEFKYNNTSNDLLGKAFDKLGAATYTASRFMDKRIEKEVRRFSDPRIIGTKKFDERLRDWKDLNHDFIRASQAYTPYMAAKAETARWWDTGRMDMAVEGLIDGVTKFKFGEFKRGIGEIRDAFMHRNFSDPAREAEAKHRDVIDQSPPDILTETDEHRRGREESSRKFSHPQRTHKPGENWLQRTFTGPAPEEKREETRAARHPAKPERAAERRPPGSHAEQEALRDALASLRPPTNSVH